MTRVTLLGVEVDLVTIDDLNAAIAEAVRKGKKIVIAHHNLHSVYLYARDSKMRALYRMADVVHIDGMSLVLWGRLLGYPVRRKHRVTYVDWVRPLMAEAARRGWRVFYLGGRPGVAERAAARLRAEFQGLNILTRHGYFDTVGAENEAIVQNINAVSPHILMVGMGMPRQEHWVLDNVGRLRVNAILLAGACFDYIAGVVPTPPRWSGKFCLEWVFRLIAEPRRLWRRYIVEPVYLIPRAIRDICIRVR